mmetsp:Transcript_25765/g.60653  ORF Transcript_25765/g.60653 Transcript_25765/m.60653 type:complete len:688 (+) Transcript_25765:108-2171(+)
MKQSTVVELVSTNLLGSRRRRVASFSQPTLRSRGINSTLLLVVLLVVLILSSDRRWVPSLPVTAFHHESRMIPRGVAKSFSFTSTASSSSSSSFFLKRKRRTPYRQTFFQAFGSSRQSSSLDAGLNTHYTRRHNDNAIPYVQNRQIATSSPTLLCSAKTSFPDLPPSQRGTQTATISSIMDNNSENERIAHYTPYEQWVRRLYMTNLFHPVKLGLQNIQQLYAALGHPLDDIPVIHVAGTNGKGSVVYKLANTLMQQESQELQSQDQSPKKVGMFVSPHISSFRERMQVNGELITEAEVVELLPQIYQICQDQDIPATFFEITTALAFSFFAKRRVDAVVLETGLGGRLDSTNVLTAPTLAIITSIGLEHTRILGDTIELIALEKGGIIKARRPVLVGPHVPHHVLRPCAHDKQASGYYISDEVLEDDNDNNNINGAAERITDYDQENARIARAALKLLQAEAPQLCEGLTEADIQKGTSVRPPCRFEQIPVSMDNGEEFTVILDVAHNPPAMDYLVHKLQSTFWDNGEDDERVKFRMVVGMSNDKDLDLCWKAVLKAVDGNLSRIHLVEAAHPRAAKLEDIVATAAESSNGESLSKPSYHFDLEDRSVTHQVQNAMKMASSSPEKEVLVVCGSVFLMAEAREALGFDEPRDSEYIAEVAGAGSKHGQENFGNSGGITTLSSNKATP